MFLLVMAGFSLPQRGRLKPAITRFLLRTAYVLHKKSPPRMMRGRAMNRRRTAVYWWS